MKFINDKKLAVRLLRESKNYLRSSKEDCHWRQDGICAALCDAADAMFYSQSHNSRAVLDISIELQLEIGKRLGDASYVPRWLYNKGYINTPWPDTDQLYIQVQKYRFAWIDELIKELSK